MLEYEWANHSPMMIPGSDDEPPAPPEPVDQSRQIFEHFSTASHHHSFPDHNSFISPPPPPPPPMFHHHHGQTSNSNNSFFDPRAAAYAGYGNHHHHPSVLSLDPSPYFLVPKSEEDGIGGGGGRGSDYSSRIGLNLGGRTYFSSAEDDFVSRLYRRSRSTLDGGGMAANAPRCQAEGCGADLTHAKHYHRRHKVCEFHSKAATVIAAGLTQRFCQQCSRFHILSEFDNGKRSCRKRLADHNRRRRKSHQNNVNCSTQGGGGGQDTLKAVMASNNSPPERSPSESGVQSSSSVTVAVSPPRMFLECFKERPSYLVATASSSSSASSSSLFFLSG